MDPQEKWLSAWGGGIGGGGGRGGWEAESWKWGIGSSKSTPCLLLPLFHPSPSGSPCWRKAEWRMALVRINIIYVINIKITLLCFASGSWPRQLKGPVPTDGCFLPSFLSAPPSLAIYRDHNLLWWVFRVLFCQGQSGLSNKWSQWSGSGLAPATPPSLSVSDTCGQIHFFLSFASIAFVLDTGKNGKRRRRWQRCKVVL